MAVTEQTDQAWERVQDFIASPGRLLIDGEWVPAASGRTFETINPATEERLAEVAHGEREDVERAVRAARRAFEYELAVAADDAVGARQADLAHRRADRGERSRSSRCSSRSTTASRVGIARVADVPLAADLFHYMAGWPTKILGDTTPISAPGDYLSYTLREPVGVVGQIIPWNFPLLMAAWKLGPALACGCTVVLKPAEQTPLSALYLGELTARGGPAGGRRQHRHRLRRRRRGAVGHPRCRQGRVHRLDRGRQADRQAPPPATSRRCRSSSAASRRTSSSPTPTSTRRSVGAANGIFFNHGQCCNAGSRLYIQSTRLRRGRRGRRRAGQEHHGRHGLDPDTQMGPLISDEQFDEGARLPRVRRATPAPRRSSAAGESASAATSSQPTVLTNTTGDMKVVREEIFGPVVCAMPFDDPDEILPVANDTNYGLAAGVFTRDISKAHRTAARLRAGTVWINTYHVFDAAQPFGGYKESGWGREMGHQVLENYLETKAVCVAL